MTLLDLDISAEVVQPSALTDQARQLITIRLSRAEVENLNDRYYTADSMAQAAADPDTQEQIALGLMVGHIDHPDALNDDNGNAVAFHPAQKQRAFWFRKLWFVADSKELLADIELMPTPAGQYLREQLAKGEPIKFSLRALGDCELDTAGKRRCTIDKIDGGDEVETPALPDATVLAVSTLTDSTIKKPCCDECQQGLTCKDKKIPATTRTPINPLGDRAQARPRVSGQTNRNRTLGDANTMNAELLKKIASEEDPEKRALMAEMASMFMGSGDAPVVEEKKKEADPMAESQPPVYDEKKIADTVNRTVADRLKEMIAEADLNAVREVTKEREAAKQRQSVTDAIAEVEKAGEIEGRKLVNYSESQLKVAFKIAAKKPTAEEAKESIIDSLTTIDENKLTATPRPGGAKGATVDVITDEAEKMFLGPLEKIEAAVLERNKKLRPSRYREHVERRRVNKEFVDGMWKAFLTQKDGKGAKAMMDWSKRMLTDAANPLTAADLKNQEGVFAGLLMRQIFQQLRALSLVRGFTPGSTTMANAGKTFKIPLQSYIGPAAGSYRPFYELRNGDPIPESRSAIRYYPVNTRRRALGFRLDEQLNYELESGPIGWNGVTNTLADVSDDVVRQTDTMILTEMVDTCDQYGAVQRSAEAVAAGEWTGDGSAGSLTVNVGGDIGSVTYGTNVYFAAKLLTSDANGTVNTTGYTGHPRPVVRPKPIIRIDEDGTEGAITYSYDVTIATLGSVTQVRGELDDDGNIVSIDPSAGAATPTYAVDYENGIVVFRDTPISGADAAVRPTITYYEARNYIEFNLTPGAGIDPEKHYSGLLRKHLQLYGEMASKPRYIEPDTILYHTSIGMGAFAVADLFEAQKSPVDVNLMAGFAKNDVLGSLPGMVVTHTNGNFPSGARRAIQYLKDEFTAYAVASPLQVKGPIQGSLSASSGSRDQVLDEQIWYARLIDAVDTPVRKNSSGTIINHPGKTIRFVGSLVASTQA